MCPFDKSDNVTNCHQFKRLISWPANDTDCERIVLSQEVETLKNAAEKLKQKLASLTPTEENTKNASIPQNRFKRDIISRTSCEMQVLISELREIKSVLEESNEIVNKNPNQGKAITSTVSEWFEKPCASLNANENAKTKLGTMTKNKLGSAVLDILFVLRTIPNIAFDAMPVSLSSYFDSLSSGGTIGVSESMSNNLLRLSSFSTFPGRVNIFSSRFTSAGFYFTGQSDTVKCYACGVTHSNWRSGENPLEIHKQLNPNCPHLQNIYPRNDTRNTASVDVNRASSDTSERNLIERVNGDKNIETGTLQNNCIRQIPIGTGNTHNHTITVNGRKNEIKNNSKHSSTDINTETQTQNSAAACSQNRNARNEKTTNKSDTYVEHNGYREHNERSEFHSTSNISGNELTQTNQSMAATNIAKPEEDIQNLGINFDKPKYPNYAPIQVRISSYQNWPGYLDQTPKTMASAGFLYAGYNDYTRCFFCGGGLRNWEAGDDPWVEHARWFPKCAYLLQNKGSKFIRVVQEKHQQIMAEHNNPENTGTNLSTQNENQPNQTHAMINNASSQNPLETVAARSVLEMGYSNDQVLQAIEKLKTLKKDVPISATEIMTVLLEDNLEKSSLSTNTTQGPALAGKSAARSTSNNDTTEPTNGTKRKNPSNRENQQGFSIKIPSSQAASEETLTTNELASAIDDTEQLLEENRQLRDQRLCKVCLDLEASIAFLPCGHLVCCADCAPAMRKCPICRARVKGTVKTFLI